MILVMKLIAVAVLGYLLGSINTSIIVSRFYGTDIREHGSGNAGMTNTLRTLGKSAAVFVILGDLLKGVLACLFGFFIIGEPGITADIVNRTYMQELGLMTGGLAAILGHNWPVFFGFRGGKGILTSFSVVLMADSRIALILIAIFIIIVAITRYISLGSIVGSALFPIAAFVFSKSSEFIIFAFIVGFLAVIRHHANIERLFKGTESKFTLKKKT